MARVHLLWLWKNHAANGSRRSIDSEGDEKSSHGRIAATCGVVNGSDLPLSIFRFIVKGVQLAQLVHKVGLSELSRSIEQILQGQMQSEL